jgi:hypothetical protein
MRGEPSSTDIREYIPGMQVGTTMQSAAPDMPISYQIRIMTLCRVRLEATPARLKRSLRLWQLCGFGMRWGEGFANSHCYSRPNLGHPVQAFNISVTSISGNLPTCRLAPPPLELFTESLCPAYKGSLMTNLSQTYQVHVIDHMRNMTYTIFIL